MELGGARKNRKNTFFTYGFFGNFSRSRGSQRGNYSEEMKNYFPGAKKTRNIWDEDGVPRSVTMQLMPQLFLR